MAETPHRTTGRTPRIGAVRFSLCFASLVLAMGLISASLAQTAPSAGGDLVAGGPAGFRRLNETQYRRSIRDVFGADIRVPGRFEPPVREAGLLAIGDSRASISPSGFEQYELRAREIAGQVLAPERRAQFVPCAPAAPAAFDLACARTFFTQYGRALFRRPLNDRELGSTLAVAREASRRKRDFYEGLETGLSLLIASPNFIFRVERAEADPARPGVERLDAYSLASRISFLLWDAPPDAELMEAAVSGALYQSAELERQVERMIASPRFSEGVRAFFSDMLAYDRFEGLTKDQMRHPHYTSQLAADAREQSLRTITHLLITQNGDYRDLFTTRTTFLNRNLGALYRVPVTGVGPDGWVEHRFGPDEPRAGILTLAAFLMLDPTHESRSSATIRGKNIREVFLCQRVPDPPPNVDFSAVQNTEDAEHRTARERLGVHNTMPACRSCHMLTDAVGLGLENYDTIGAYRTQENGAVIDASGTFDGGHYRNAVELGALIRESPTAANCIVRRSYEYGVGRPATASEADWLREAGQGFAARNYAFPALMRAIATSRAFQTVVATQTATASSNTSSN